MRRLPRSFVRLRRLAAVGGAWPGGEIVAMVGRTKFSLSAFGGGMGDRHLED